MDCTTSLSLHHIPVLIGCLFRFVPFKSIDYPLLDKDILRHTFSHIEFSFVVKILHLIPHHQHRY